MRLAATCGAHGGGADPEQQQTRDQYRQRVGAGEGSPGRLAAAAPKPNELLGAEEDTPPTELLGADELVVSPAVVVVSSFLVVVVSPAVVEVSPEVLVAPEVLVWPAVVVVSSFLVVVVSPAVVVVSPAVVVVWPALVEVSPKVLVAPTDTTRLRWRSAGCCRLPLTLRFSSQPQPVTAQATVNPMPGSASNPDTARSRERLAAVVAAQERRK